MIDHVFVSIRTSVQLNQQSTKAGLESLVTLGRITVVL